MKNIAIIYGSTTGNTEQVANTIAGYLNKDNVTVLNVNHATPHHILQADLVLLGSSTWGYGEIQDDFQSFYDTMNADTFRGKSVAIFGCGDSVTFSDVFCEAVNLIETKAKDLGAILMTDSLKVDGDVDNNHDAIKAFASSLV